MTISRFARGPLVLGLAAVAGVAMLATPMLSAAKPSAASAPAPIAAEQAPQLSGLQQLQVEFLTIRQQLAEAEQQAMEDPELRQAHEALQASIQEAARKLDDRHALRLERLAEIEKELQTAQATGTEPDAATVEPLITEAQGLQERVIAVTDHVAKSEPLKSEIEQMRERMLAKMTALNPEVPKLLQRLETLAAELQSSQGQQG